MLPEYSRIASQIIEYMSLPRITALITLLTLGLSAGAEEPSTSVAASEKIDVYVIPITDAISQPNLFVLRRGLKEAITNDVGMILLEMDTPGGRVDVTLEMMEMLAKFDGITATYINPDAISAGSFIAAATQEIYFAPEGKVEVFDLVITLAKAGVEERSGGIVDTLTKQWPSGAVGAFGIFAHSLGSS